MNEKFILFNNKYYQQLDGVSMGSPIGPTFANICLISHDVILLQNCPLDFKSKAYRRYINDTF